MNDPAAFAKLVPGFDFLQGLVGHASSAMPSVGQWIAPTFDPAELEKRIEELRTVQFWLEQNARLLGATIQALEMQRMTLSTLKTMNVSFGDLADSLRIRMPEPAADKPRAAEAPAPAPAAAPDKPAATRAPRADNEPAAPIVPAGVADPMQWWSALTQQFTELATSAMKDGGADAARKLAGTMVSQGLEAAGQTMSHAAAVPKAAAKRAAAVPGATRKGAPTGKKTAARQR